MRQRNKQAPQSAEETLLDRHAGLVHYFVGTVELNEISLDGGLDLAKAPLEFLAREALRLGIHGFELAAGDRDDAGVHKTEAAAKCDDLLAHLADGRTDVAAEVGDDLELGSQTPVS